MKRSTTFERALGALTLLSFLVLAWLALFVTRPDVEQGEYARFIYIHPALATGTYVAFGITALASIMYLWKRTRSRFWDALAGSSAEIGVLFCGLTLVTGSLWGRPVWGVYWTWDARLTTTAILFVMFLGYLALRRLSTDIEVRSRRSAIAALIAAVDVPIVHYSVHWWNTLHQGETLLAGKIHGMMLATMLLGMFSFSLLYLWLVIKRFRLERLEDQYGVIGIEQALIARRDEASHEFAEAGV